MNYNYGEMVNMNKAQLIEFIYHLSEEYLGTNYDRNSGDIAYNLGMKEGIEGFRNYLRRNLFYE